MAGSVPLWVLGGLLVANLNENPTVCGIGALLTFAAAAYLLLVGAVARGIQVAGRVSARASRVDQPSLPTLPR